MSRFPAVGGGSDSAYSYVRDGYPTDAQEGDSLYHITEDAAYVYTGTEWVEQTVTSHSQLSDITADAHHSPPSSTNSAGVSGGWKEWDDTSWRGVTVDGLRGGSDQYEATVNLADGRSYTTNGGTQNFTAGEIVGGVSRGEVHVVQIPDHSHSI